MRALAAAALLLTACGEAGERAPDPAPAGAPAQAVADAPPPLDGENVWIVDGDASTILFTGRQNDKEFTGRFEDFSARIRLDPDDLSDALIEASVDLASVDAGAGDRNQSLPEAGWFDTDRFPQATFRADTVRAVGEGAYEADGTLTIKGASRPVTLPFTLDVQGDRAVADGQVVIDRSDFGIGQGDFAGPEWVAFEVAVAVHLEADRRP